jgi:glycosidase
MSHWSQDAVFYHLFPLGLCGAPARNDLAQPPSPRLEQLFGWVAHARELGANALFLGPVFESSSHGYDTVDYSQVDRRLGTTELLARLISDAHRQGMRVILDAVLGHVGRQFWGFEDVRAKGPGSACAGWFRGLTFDRRSPLGDAFSYEPWKGFWELARLEQRSPAVRSLLFGAIDRWIAELDIDGLRLDTADWLDFDFLAALREHCDRVRPGFWLMGEVIHGDYRRWVNDRTLHSVTNYECFKGLYSSLNDRNYFEIAYALNRQFGAGGLYRGLPLYNFADNHDVHRVASNLRDRAHLFPLYALLFTMPGVPSIYYGSELGVAARRTDTDDKPLRPHLDLATLLQQGDTALLAAIRRLAKLRHDAPALRHGDYAQLHVSAEQLAFSRTLPEETLIVALNASANLAPVELSLPGARGARLADLLDPAAPLPLTAERVRLEIPPRWARVLRVER